MMRDPMLDVLLKRGPVKVVTKSEYFAPGSGLIALRRLAYDGPVAAGGTGKFEELTFVTEWQVVSSEPSGDVDGSGNLIQPNQSGSIVAFIQKPGPSKAGRIAPRKIKMVIMALTGLSDEDAEEPVESTIDVQTPTGQTAKQTVIRPKWAAALREFASEDQPGRGIVCRYRASLTQTEDARKKGLARHQWPAFAEITAYTQKAENVEKLALILSEGGRVTPKDVE